MNTKRSSRKYRIWMSSLTWFAVVYSPGDLLAHELPGESVTVRPVSFAHDVMGVLGRAGCNSGACHGHNSGKGGFKLSLRGYDPAADHRAITGEDFYRIDRDAPDESLIVQKPTAQMEHGGGKRFELDTQYHRMLRRWIEEGAKSDVGTAARLARIEVIPEEVVMPKPGSQQIHVLAHFADGSTRDVTHLAIFEVSKEGVVETDTGGLVSGTNEGEAAVLVRYLRAKGVARFLVLNHKPDFVFAAPPPRNFIDQHVDAKLRRIQVKPSPPASDAEFLRRVSFDTIGLPPRPEEVRAFLADDSPDQRARKIDELLDREEFAAVWAQYWVERSGTTESGDSARFKGMWTLYYWIRDAVDRNMPYDEFVRALVTAKGSSLHQPAMTFTTHRLPKNETVAQLFLGVRLECAQCHDHPFDVWTQSDYQALGKFFEGVADKEGALDAFGREIRRFVPPERFLPWEKDKLETLRHLDGSTAQVPATRDRRESLVDWMFSAAQEQTARALVNRVWGRMFGRGIVEPVDDMRFSNPPVNEPLLDALAKDFIQHEWDFKHLVRTILNSGTYQRSSIPDATNAGDRMNFSHAYLRRLSAEQLLDAVAQVTGVDESFNVAPPGTRAMELPYSGSRFLTLFGRPQERASPCECIRSAETTLPQIMHLLAGETILEKLQAEEGKLAALVASMPDNEPLIEDLYLLVLSRFPSEEEADQALRYFSNGLARDQAAEDLAWALLSSSEFLLNH